MDVYDRTAAWVTAHVLQHPAVIDTVISGVSWAHTVGKYVECAYELAEVHMPEGLESALKEIVEPAGEYLEQKELADYAVELNESLNESQSVDIGGPQVEAEIAELKKLQEEHEIAQAELTADIEKYREHLIEQYAESPDEMQQQLERFDEAAMETQRDLADQQAVELQMLQEEQQLRQQELHEQQLQQEELQQEALQQQEEVQQQEELRQEERQQEERRQEEQHQQEQSQQEQMQQEQIRQEQIRQEQIRQEQIRQEQIRQEQIRQEQIRRAMAARAMER